MLLKSIAANILLLVQILNKVVVVSNEAIPIYIGTIMPLSKHWFGDYGNFLNILFEFAFEEINNRTDILNNYQLKIIKKDSQNDPGLAAKRFIELITEPPTKIALLGPVFSDEIALVGQMRQYYNLLEMSFIARTPLLLNRKAYSSVYMTNYLDESYNEVRIALMKNFHWERVGTLAFQETQFISQMTQFHEMLKTENYTLVTSGIIADTSQVSEHIRRLKQYDVRVIMAAIRSTTAAYTFCEAYKQGLYGSKYVWILGASAMYDGWLDKIDSKLNCTKEQVYKVAKGYIGISNRQISESEDITFSGRTPKEYVNKMNQLVNQTDYLLTRSHGFAFDAAYSIALALNTTAAKLVKFNKTLSDFNYDDALTANLIKDAIEAVSFAGVSGPVSFSRNGGRIGLTYIEVTDGDDKTTVAFYDPKVGRITWIKDDLTLFNGNPAPKDRFTYIEVYKPYNVISVVLVLILNSIGFIVAVLFLVFNISYRKNKRIKMSSPNINNIIIVGCLVMYLSVYINCVEYMRLLSGTLKSRICMIKLWIFLLGFTLAFGALFSKTWRVHVLFRQSALTEKKSIKDYQLIMIVLILIFVDLLILVPWSIVHPLEAHEIKVVSKEMSDDDNIVTVIYTSCSNPSDIYWFASVYVYKGLLLVLGTFLAWETRKITVEALNDSKLIGFCVYNIVVVCGFGAPVLHVLSVQQTTLLFVLLSLLTTFCTTLVLCILFVPKFKLRHQTGDIRFVTTLKNNPSPRNGDGIAVLTPDTGI